MIVWFVAFILIQDSNFLSVNERFRICTENSSNNVEEAKYVGCKVVILNFCLCHM